MALNLITYTDKTDLNAPTDVPKQATAADFNEIKTVVNAAVSEINGLAAGERYCYTINLPIGASVAARIAAAVEGVDYPTGWVLAAGSSAVDIDIQHGLTRRAASVTVFAVTGTQEQQLFNTAAYNGIITDDEDNLRIQSLATILKEISIYIVFN